MFEHDSCSRRGFFELSILRKKILNTHPFLPIIFNKKHTKIIFYIINLFFHPSNQIKFLSFSQNKLLVSARTERCLSNSSDVIINTGPLFNGKISVENSNDTSCSIYGNGSYTQEEYHLIISHEKCGSSRKVK